MSDEALKGRGIHWYATHTLRILSMCINYIELPQTHMNDNAQKKNNMVSIVKETTNETIQYNYRDNDPFSNVQCEAVRQ